MTEENKNFFKATKFRSFFDKRNKKNFTSILSKRAPPPKLNLDLNINDSSESTNNNQNNNNINNKNVNNIPSSYRFTSRNNNISNYNSLYSQRNEFFSPLSSRLKTSLKSFQTSNFVDNNKDDKIKLKLNLKENSLENKKVFTKLHKNANRLLSLRLFPNQKLIKNITNDSKQNNLIIDKNRLEDLLKSQREEKNIISTEANKQKIPYKKITKQKSLTNYSNQINIDSSDTDLSKKLQNSNLIQKRRSTIFIARDYNKTFYAPIKGNPLAISEEDKIFEERKKYLYYKYETKNKNRTARNFRKANIKPNINAITAMKLKKLKERNKYLSEDKKKLNYLYLSNSKISRKIKGVTRKKANKDLTEYQSNLLLTIKPYISYNRFTSLKNKLFAIRNKSEKIYQNNYKKIKEIEEEEEDVIHEINDLYQKCTKTFDKIRQERQMVRYTNLRIKLPFLNFVSCIHHHKVKDKEKEKDRDKEKEKEKKSKLKKKSK